MLAPKTRAALRIGAVLYIVLGLVLFAAPTWAATVFPWSVSSMGAMTIGGWTIGNGIAAWFASAPGPATRVMPILVYLAAFAAAQLLVVIAFRSGLKLDVILAVPYLVTLGFTLVAAAFGILELRSSTAIVLDVPEPLSRSARLLLGGLTLSIGALAVAGFLAGEDGLSTTGQIFPEPLILFTVRALAAFFLALVFGLVALLMRPDAASAFTFGIAGLALTVTILIAALVNIGAFDFAERPLGILYLAVYVAVLIPTAVFLWRHRSLA